MKFKIALGVLAIAAMLGIGTFTAGGRMKAEDEYSYVKPSPVYGYVIDGCIVYDGAGGRRVDLLTDSTRVEIIRDISTQWYYVRYGSTLGWVKAENLSIPDDEKANDDLLTAEETEKYAQHNFDIHTHQLVWVDIDRQRVYVLCSENGKWKLLKNIVCSTGKNKSPTIRGTYTIQDRGEWFYSERLGSGAKYWVRFNGSYLFHSVAMDKDKNIIDDTLGEKSSSGCVRMSVENAQWFYENVEEGSVVWVN